MSAFRRVEDERAGPAALGVLAPPGRRTGRRGSPRPGRRSLPAAGGRAGAVLQHAAFLPVRSFSYLIMPYTPILATLVYVFSPDGRQVLLVHRNRRPDDAHFGKYNGLGGKVDRGEDVVACIRREIREEAGLECDRLLLRGTISWPGFGKRGEDWFGFIFRGDAWHGTPRTENP